jgi:hypothetical protein
MKGVRLYMLQNGNLTVFRIVSSAILGLVGIGGGIYLLHTGVTIPREYWLIVGASITGVVGVDVLASIIKTIKPQ